MIIIRAAHLGMCFGVRDAITLAERELARGLGPIASAGPLVHNEKVHAGLEALGLQIAPEPATPDQRVLITAHGVSDRTRQDWERRSAGIIDATCPLVQFAHRSLHQLKEQGYFPVIIGQATHVEVRGLTGDCDEYAVVLSEEEVMHLPERARYGVVSQTTQPVERVRQLVGCLRRRFVGAEVKWVDTVCQPTKQRQRAAVDLAREVEMVVVVGGARSNNTRELAATCLQFCSKVHVVQGPQDLELRWFSGVQRAGLTAGTSTPDEIIDAVEEGMRRMAAAGNRPQDFAVGQGGSGAEN